MIPPEQKSHFWMINKSIYCPVSLHNLKFFQPLLPKQVCIHQLHIGSLLVIIKQLLVPRSA